MSGEKHMAQARKIVAQIDDIIVEDGGFCSWGAVATAASDIERNIAAALAKVEAWQPIETAPRDGTRFLAFEVIGPMDEYDDDDNRIARGKFERGCVVAYYLDFGFGGSVVPYPWNGGISQNVNYTHWMPLPAPPAILAEGEKRQDGGDGE